MNIISPFGRLSRKGYLVVAVPVLVVIGALVWTTKNLVSPPDGPLDDIAHTPWFRWLLIAGPLDFVMQWCLFCACVKRLHDFRWSGILALPLLATWLQIAGSLVVPATDDYSQMSMEDVSRLAHALYEVTLALRIYSLALLIALAIVPGAGRPAADPDAA
jgi:uncharacterized membrane protein YhaH (DUF805 family)